MLGTYFAPGTEQGPGDSKSQGAPSQHETDTHSVPIKGSCVQWEKVLEPGWRVSEQLGEAFTEDVATGLS